MWHCYEKPREVGAGVCSTNRNAKPRENALSISITDSENLELEEERHTKPSGWPLFSLGTHAYVEDATRETSFWLCIAMIEKKGHNKLNS